MTFTRTSASRSPASASRGLSSALVDLREAQNLTVYAVCKGTGLSRTVLENAELDAAGTKFGVLVVLADFYGLPDVTDLLTLAKNRDRQAVRA
jgi:transcriptional regulator with XRE-family HTH domain